MDVNDKRNENMFNLVLYLEIPIPIRGQVSGTSLFPRLDLMASAYLSVP